MAVGVDDWVFAPVVVVVVEGVVPEEDPIFPNICEKMLFNGLFAVLVLVDPVVDDVVVVVVDDDDEVVFVLGAQGFGNGWVFSVPAWRFSVPVLLVLVLFPIKAAKGFWLNWSLVAFNIGSSNSR